MRFRRTLLAVALAVVITAGAWTVGRPFAGPSGEESGGPPPPRGAAAAVPPSGQGLGPYLARLRAYVAEQPRDAGAWAALGTGRVEQARRTADPRLYGQAEDALDRSLALRPARANDGALAGQAALAAARHDFPRALRLARRSLAVNPYGELALAVRVDALVELGRYGPARTAALRADARRPGIPAFTRLAYVEELRGDRGAARRALELAHRSAVSPSDRAQTATALGELDRAEGRGASALRRYAEALRAEPGHLPALSGRGQVRAARGHWRGAVSDLRAVTARQPLPAPLALLGEVHEARGRRDAARRQYSALGAWAEVARAQRVRTGLDTALADADHGDRGAALRAARAEWDRRKTVDTADALAWALHRKGQDARALPLARRAAAPGYRNAMFLYHRAEIERALGRTTEADRHTRQALRLRTALTPQARTVLESR
ncbi:tetratricopeptide repeat protein [Streptomyces albiaxialis]|uniref:Tetratricopeptide repeat protein n=1 Tax=Streptomyces albiaxialis TaxID=329523 RepID=A0ABN2WXM0_9ACTN